MGEVNGDGTSSGYTAVSWKDTANGSADDGATITPNGGDTTKTLFLANAGMRMISGSARNYDTWGYSWSAEQHPTTASNAWRLVFGSDTAYSSGNMYSVTKLDARSIRCVRS